MQNYQFHVHKAFGQFKYSEALKTKDAQNKWL